MSIDFDYAAARNAGYSDDQILHGLKSHGELDFDVDAALKKYSASDILQGILPKQQQAAVVKPTETTAMDRLKDVGISALKGAIGVPEAAVGLADIVTGGYAGKGAEALGFRPAEAKAALNEQYSDAQKAANQRVADAKGFLPTVGAMVSNPSTILQTGVESLPSMGAGGVVGRGALALAPKIGATIGGAIGEGAVGAGQTAEQIRQSNADGTLSLGQSAAALGSGIGTGAFAAVGGRIAEKLGIADIDTALVQAHAPVASSKGVIRRMIEGGVSEGVFEELPQSIQEQMWQNAAMDKPLLDGVGENAAQGLIAGGLFGGIAGGALHGKPHAETPAPATAPLLLGNTPDPFLSFPDGSVGRRSDAEAFINRLPEHEQEAARARLFGGNDLTPQPVTPNDVLQAQSVDEAIATANRAVEQGSPEFQAQRNNDIDAAWLQHLTEQATQRQAEFQAAEDQRRAAETAPLLNQVADQRVAQADAVTNAQGFDQPAPTAMQLAMQEAQARRVAATAEVPAPATIESQQRGESNGIRQDLVGRSSTAINAPVAGNIQNAVQEQPSGQQLGSVDARGSGSGPAAIQTPAAPNQQNSIPAQQQRTQAQTDASVARAKTVLTAAGVTGNERMAALRSIRTGENTIEDLIDAHPPKAQEVVNEPAGVRPGLRDERTNSTEAAAPVQQRVTTGGEVATQPVDRGEVTTEEPARPARKGVVDATAQNATPALAKISGRQIDGKWTEFARESGTLGIGREQMPQVKAEHRGALTNFLEARGITHETTEVPAGDLKPTQHEFSNEKVQQARDYQGGDRSILISSDNHILDGHHQWLAKLGTNEPVKVIRLDAPIRELLAQVHDFPSSEQARGATTKGVQNATQEVSQQSSTEGEYRQGDSVRQTSEASSSDRIQRTEGSAEAPRLTKSQEEVARLRAARDERLAAQRNKPQTKAQQATEDKYARQEAEIARAKENAEARKQAKEPAAEPAKPVGKVTERYLGRYGKGMSENNAKVEAAERNKANTGTRWTVEPNDDLGYDRYEVVGRKEAPLKSEAPITGGLTATAVNKAIINLRAKWLGFTKVNTVQSVEDLPADVRERAQADSGTEGVYDPQTKTVYLIADNIASPERAAWVAAHEVSHAGLRMLHDKSVNEALNIAGGNKYIKELAEAIQEDRGNVSQQVATEEAIAELSAATESDDFAALEDRYGVKVPAASRNGVIGAMARVYEAVKRFLASITGKPIAEVSNADVRALIGEQRAAVEGRETNAPKIETKLAQSETDMQPALQSRAPVSTPEEVIPKWAADLPEAQKAALRKSGVIYTEKTMKQKVAELKDGALKKLQYGILDQFAPIKDQLGKIPYVMARMAKNADGTLEALMLYGRPHLDSDGGMLVDTTKKGFIETMQMLNGEHDRFFSWMAGRRAEQLKKEGRENLFTNEDISALSTLNQGQMKDGQSREAVYLKAQKDVAELNKSVLDIAEKSGLIDGESRKVWASDFYVPFYRVMEEGITGPSIKSGLVNQKSIKKLKGGTNNLGDLTQNMLMNWSTLLTASAKNRAAKASLDAATQIGAATEADEATIRQMGKAASTKAVSYMENGVNRWHVVEDEHLLAAISALEFNGYNNQAMKVMSKFKNYLTLAVTSMPGFKVRNLIRDSISTIAVSDAGYNPLMNLKNGYSLLHDKQTKADLIAGGGVYRFGTYMEGNRAENVKRLIDSGVADDTILNTAEKMTTFTKKLWHSYQELGDLSENLNRAALYQKLRNEGKSHLEASFEARDLMDFGLSGAWAGVRALNQILPFFNARLQGLYKLGRGYNDDPRRMGTVIGAVALASVALLLAYKDDDDFKKRTDSDRNNYWWFKVGGTAYRIPRPFEIGAMGSAIEHLTALMVDPENTNAKRFANQLGDIVNGQLAMNPIPQVFRPLIDVYSNKDAFTGRPIENMAMQRLKPEDRYTYNTSELARLLSKSGAIVDPLSLVSGTGVKQLSPVQIDSLIKGYFSGLGTLATAAVDGLLHHSVIDRGEALPATIKTFAGSFAETLPTNSSRYVDMLYSTAQDIEQSYASYRNAIKNGDIEKARQIMKDDGTEIAKYHLVESLKKNESKINQQIQRTMNSKELTGQQKEETIRRLKIEQDKIARIFATRA
jgi:hypothetical protein